MTTLSKGGRAIVDAHVHLYDSRAVTYGVFGRRDPGFEALVGDYSALPRNFLVDDYLKSARSRQVEGVVWHEFIAADPLAELAWAKRLVASCEIPMALVGIVDFSAPDLARRLEIYRATPKFAAVRQHLGWDDGNALRRMASRPDYMSDPAWLAGLATLKSTGLRCGLEVFSPQLKQLLAVVRAHPDIAFTIAVMGWPARLDAEGFAVWRTDLAALGRCDNTCASISAIECIFGTGWNEPRVAPWISAVIEAFGPRRCMFGSHLPIDNLSWGFDRLYDAYESFVASFSEDERDAMFRRTALHWFGVISRVSAAPGRSTRRRRVRPPRVR